MSRCQRRRSSHGGRTRLTTATEISAVLLLRKNETFQEIDPVVVRLLVNVELVVDAGENLAFHFVDLGQLDAGDLRPRLVGVRIAEDSMLDIASKA